MKEEIKRKKFWRKIFKVFILISIIPLLIVSANSLYTTIETREKNIAELQSLALENASEKTKRFLNQKMETFHLIVSGSPADISEIDQITLEHLIEGLEVTAGDIKEISFADKDGEELIKKSQVSVELANIFNDPEFITAASGQDYFGPVEYWDSQPVMRMSSPIKNKDGLIIGVINSIVDLSPLEKIISQIKLGNTGFIYVVDSEGKLLASSEPTMLDKKGEALKHIDLIEDIMSGSFHDGLKGEDIYINKSGQKVIFAGRPMGKVAWSVISEWPQNDAFEITRNILKSSLIIIVLSLIFVIVIALWVTRKVVKPIEILGQGTEEISKGNFNKEIHLTTGDEFEVLGERFNHMMGALKENQKLKDEFVFISAHELRAPVTAIRGYLSMILDGSFGSISPAIEKNLKIINGANERLVQLVRDLLEVARNDSGTLKLEITPVPISECIQNVMLEFGSLALAKDIKIKYEEPTKKLIHADINKLKEILVNLINNSIKYTLNSGNIEISHEIKDNLLITHIKDQGMGIAKENLEKLFSKFYRVKTEETAKIEGTGLGLFICKNIIEKMGGQIWVDSTFGQGSTFSFSLPLART